MKQNILVTGVNGDIGREIVIQALERGKHVYATVRNDKHRDSFKQHDHLQFLNMHVDDTASVNSSFEELDTLLQGEPLHAVIHCAAIQNPSTVEFLQADHIERTLKVNTLGSLAVMQCAFPRLRQSGGNLVIASSLWGRISGPLVSAYAASKWALEALIHTARRETVGMGFSISTANIGAVKSRMLDSHVKGVQALLDRAGEEEQKLYGKAYSTHIAQTKQFNSVAISVDKVAQRLLDIAEKEKPAVRYAIGMDAKALRFLDWILPASLMDKILGV